MQARLILVTGEGQREHVLVAFNTLGRHPDNTVQLLDRIVSKEHCRITRGPQGRYVLRDVGSLNGSFVNGERITEHTLQNGDEISLGNTVLRFEEDSASIAQPKHMTLFSDAVQSQVRSRVDASAHFLPAAQIENVEALRADYEKLRIAHELSQRLSVDTDLDELCRKIVEETFQLIRADRAVILLVDQETGELVPQYVKQKREDEKITLSSSILEEVKNNKRAVLSSDAMVDERFKAAKSIIMQGIRSTMCVPMLHADKLVGAMHMDSMLNTGAFTEKDLTLFQGIATQAAVAIENNRLALKIEREAETRAQFQRLLSPNLVEQIVAGALQLDQAGSKRDVTMLFADIRGFTSMSERHAPEEMVRTLNEYFEVMVDVLFNNGGTLDKYVGDEIIGLFGAPVERPDSPVLAVRCALEMQRALEEFNRMRVATGADPIQIGIGVNTGPVIAGAIGSSRTLQYTVIGDAVNVASRLCSTAGPGEVLISQSTYDLVRGQVAVEDRDPVMVKGKSKAIQIYRATGILESTVASASSPSRATQAMPPHRPQ
ncbi:MAG: FHA domain-containing protein [Deltaproteobacteria bacterium]|nr:FHA domain-containing protein [Deltaproteobacteria bacterium]MBK8236034.1 FHA domain-containing protein [Deltaproteobacteria bacterium]MBK8713657.1 FHA domain-containing protein [Deltaproteobacteria bacterium]MBP7288870.1 FHA domain-containing protein [Nannocystaceae bacterium]